MIKTLDVWCLSLKITAQCSLLAACDSRCFRKVLDISDDLFSKIILPLLY